MNKISNFASNKRVLPPQSSAEDTSNWDNRAIALPDPTRSQAQFMMGDNSNLGMILGTENPYLAQERTPSVKRKK